MAWKCEELGEPKALLAMTVMVEFDLGSSQIADGYCYESLWIA
jgi:hypothetical protein